MIEAALSRDAARAIMPTRDRLRDIDVRSTSRELFRARKKLVVAA